MQKHFLSSRFILLFSFLLLSLSSCHKPQDQSTGMPPNFVLPVSMLEVTPTSIPITAEAVGQTEGAKEVEIRPRVGGILLKRKYKDRKSTRLNSSHMSESRMPSSA